MSDVTLILSAIEQGDSRAAAGLLPLVYDELRQLARQHMARERAGHTLQATALVHEAYMRLVGDANLRWESRGRFFAAASEAMRRILIEHARRRKGPRRGGDHDRVDLDEHALPLINAAAHNSPEELLDLNDALERLEAQDPDKAQLVKLTYFGGLSLEQAGEAMGISRATAYRFWTFARAWLRDAMSSGSSATRPALP